MGSNPTDGMQKCRNLVDGAVSKTVLLWVRVPPSVRTAYGATEDATVSDTACCEFESHYADFGWLAQLVEQWTENPRVGGSIPPSAILIKLNHSLCN